MNIAADMRAYTGRRTQQRRQCETQGEHDGDEEAENAGKKRPSIRLPYLRGRPGKKA